MKSIPGVVKNDRIEFAPRSLYLFTQKNQGKKVDVVVREVERSMSQLGMYRAWLADVAQHTGNDTEELHEFLLEKCAPRIVMQIHGAKRTVEVVKYKRTSGGTSLSMNKEEMAEYMDKVAAMTGYPLPTKEELEAMGYVIESKIK